MQAIYEQLQAALPDVTVEDWWDCPPGLPRLWGCVLVQFTRWAPNAQRALANLTAADLLTPARLAAVDPDQLGDLIRPAGFYRQKAATLRALAEFVLARGGPDALGRQGAQDPDALRRGLLGVRGIGPETADAMLMYVWGLPSFIGDTYSRRLLGRLTGSREPSYDEVRRQALGAHLSTADLALLHALVVVHGQRYCTARAPRCQDCCFTQSCKAAAVLGNASDAQGMSAAAKARTSSDS